MTHRKEQRLICEQRPSNLRFASKRLESFGGAPKGGQSAPIGACCLWLRAETDDKNKNLGKKHGPSH